MAKVPAPLPVDRVTSNNTFDSRIRSIPFAQADTGFDGGQLQHGYLLSAYPRASTTPSNPTSRYQLNLLYNPSVVTVSHSMDASSAMAPPYLRSSDDSGVPLASAGGTLSFSLLFDRTYETSDSSQFADPTSGMGVLVDVNVLYGLVGVTTPLSAKIFKSAAATAGGSADTVNSAIASDPNQVVGIMQMYPVWAVFGMRRDPTQNNAAPISLMRYFGYVSSINITYSHFTQRMTPVRCAIDVQLTLMTSAGYLTPQS